MIVPNKAALEAFVKRLSSRSVLTEAEIKAILSLPGQVRKVAAHTDFVRYGEYVEHACLIVDGLAGRYGTNPDGSRQITGLHIPGDMADLPSLVSPKSGWGLSALTGTTMLRIPHEDLRRIAGEHLGVAEALWRDCVADGSIYSEWVVNVGRRGALSRIAHLFCQMAVRYELAGLGDRSSYPLPATQLDVGDATGLTAIHVNRMLKELRTMSVVEFRDGKVVISDWKQLAAIAQFNTTFMLLDETAPRIFPPLSRST